MPYVSKIYIKNKKNKFEAIQKIYLQIDKKTIIELADYTYDPLLIEPFKSITKGLNPLTCYNTFPVNIYDSSLDRFIQKNFVLDKGHKDSFLLRCWENKIIIQTEDGIFPVNTNIKRDDSELNKFNRLLPSSEYGRYGKVLSAKIRAVCYFELESKPKDIHAQDAWQAFCTEQDFIDQYTLNADEEIKILSTKNLKNKFTTKELDQFGLQVVMMKDSGEHSAQYYAVTKDNEKYIIESPVSWWEDFYTKYKNCLEKEEEKISSVRRKLPAPSDDVFISSLKKLIGEKRVKTLIRKMSFSYRDTDPEGYYFSDLPFRSFPIFCMLLDNFLQEKQATMKIIDSSIIYNDEHTNIGYTNIGVHYPEDVVYKVKDLLDDANAFPRPEARKHKRKKPFTNLFLKSFFKSIKNTKVRFIAKHMHQVRQEEQQQQQQQQQQEQQQKDKP